MRTERVTLGRIYLFWAPLQATWLMMAVEGPFLAAIIARQAHPKVNLAAYGVAFAVAILVEAPIMMLLSASTALVDGAHSFRRLRNFTHALNGLITLFMLVMLLTPLWGFIARRLIGLPEEVARLTEVSLLILLPWPAAIGYRRFYQGLLIRNNLTRRVAYGTVIRLGAIAAVALALYLAADLPGAYVGAGALSFAVCVEAVASRLMVRRIVSGLLAGGKEEAPGAERLTYGRMTRFYYPLALTSTLTLTAHPIVTFFMGRAPHPLESLAVLPVVNSLVFIFRSIGLSFQEVCLAMFARGDQTRPQVEKFAWMLAALSTLGLACIAYTPLATVWFHHVSGLSLELTAFALVPTRILVLIPALAALISLQRAILMHWRLTGPITGAALVEVGGIVMVLLLTIQGLGLTGATAAAIAFVVGRLGGNLFLIPSCRRVLRPRDELSRVV